MARAKQGTAKKGRGKTGKTIKDFQRGDAANGYDMAVDGDEDRGEGDNSKHFEPNSDELRDFKEIVLDEWAAIKAIDDAARLKKQGPRSSIKNASKALVESGYHAKELATLLSKWRYELKLEHVADNLDDDQLQHYRSLERALGAFAETPLGDAAVKAAMAEAVLQH